MRFDRSIRARLILGATLVLVAFMAGAGLAVQRAHEDSVRAAHFARLQSTVYLLLAGAELDAAGALVMPAAFPEPRLSLPGSGLYANVVNVNRGEQWQSASTVGVTPPFERSAAVGQWRYDTVSDPAGAFFIVAYGVKWSHPAADAPLVLSVAEDKAGFDREVGAFKRIVDGLPPVAAAIPDTSSELRAAAARREMACGERPAGQGGGPSHRIRRSPAT
jgi:two-component system sensor histidine kinase PhoQ